MPITTLFPHLAALQALQSSCLRAVLPVAVMERSLTKHVRSALGLFANKFIRVRILPMGFLRQRRQSERRDTTKTQLHFKQGVRFSKESILAGWKMTSNLRHR